MARPSPGLQLPCSFPGSGMAAAQTVGSTGRGNGARCRKPDSGPLDKRLRTLVLPFLIVLIATCSPVIRWRPLFTTAKWPRPSTSPMSYTSSRHPPLTCKLPSSSASSASGSASSAPSGGSGSSMAPLLSAWPRCVMFIRPSVVSRAAPEPSSSSVGTSALLIRRDGKYDEKARDPCTCTPRLMSRARAAILLISGAAQRLGLLPAR